MTEGSIRRLRIHAFAETRWRRSSRFRRFGFRSSVADSFEWFVLIWTSVDSCALFSVRPFNLRAIVFTPRRQTLALRQLEIWVESATETREMEIEEHLEELHPSKAIVL